jgi:D-methionine transport system substrate-binding protein
MDSVGIAIINGNYAISAGLKLSDAIYNEKIAEGYVNVIAVKTADQNSEFAKHIVAVVKSDAFKSVIEDPSKQYVSFQKPANY